MKSGTDGADAPTAGAPNEPGDANLQRSWDAAYAWAIRQSANTGLGVLRVTWDAERGLVASPVDDFKASPEPPKRSAPE